MPTEPLKNELVYVSATMCYLQGGISFAQLERAFDFGVRAEDTSSSSSSSDDEDSPDGEIEDVVNKTENIGDLTTNDLDRIIDALDKRAFGRSNDESPESPSLSRYDMQSTKTLDRRMSRYLTPEIRAMLGEANIAYGMNFYETAIEKCKDIIRKAPLASEPYTTLALIFNDQGDRQKAFELELMAAYLSNSKQDWMRVFNRCVAMSKIDFAVAAISKAITRHPTDIELQFQRLRFLDLHDFGCRRNSAVKKLFSSIINSLYCDENVLLEITKRLVKQYESACLTDKVEKVLRTVFQKLGNRLPEEEFRKLINLEVELGRFSDVVLLLLNTKRLIMQNTAIDDFEAEHIQRGVFNYLHIKDLRNRKFDFIDEQNCIAFRRQLFAAVVWLHGGYESVRHLIYDFVISIDDNNAVTDVKAMIAFAGVLMKTKAVDAKELLELIRSHKWTLIEGQRSILIRYMRTQAEILTALENLAEAAGVYKNILEMNKNDYDAALALSAIECRLGSGVEDCVEILEKSRIPTVSSMRIALERVEKEYHFVKNRVVCIECADCYNSRLADVGRILKEIKMVLFGEENDSIVGSVLNVIRWKQFGDRSTAYTKLLSTNNQLLRSGIAARLDISLKNRAYELYLSMCNLLISIGQYASLQALAVMGNVLPFLYDRSDWIAQCETITFMSSLLVGDGSTSTALIKAVYETDLSSLSVMNYLSVVGTVSPHLGFQKYVVRLNQKYAKVPIEREIGLPRTQTPPKDSTVIGTQYLLAHLCLIGGQYRQAMKLYKQFLSGDPDNPLLHLLVGTCYLMFVGQRINNDRSFAFCQAMLHFYEYRILRGDCQEVFFNIGRAFHQANLIHYAADAYEKVLATPATEQGDEIVFDLKRHAAYNLMLLYREDLDDNREKRMEIMSKYLII